jgi:hypothetical protein
MRKEKPTSSQDIRPVESASIQIVRVLASLNR